MGEMGAANKSTFYLHSQEWNLSGNQYVAIIDDAESIDANVKIGFVTHRFFKKGSILTFVVNSLNPKITWKDEDMVGEEERDGICRNCAHSIHFHVYQYSTKDIPPKNIIKCGNGDCKCSVFELIPPVK